MKRNLYLAAGFLFFLFSCNQAVKNNPDQSSESKKPSLLKFNKHALMDNQGTHSVAATYLVPEGWEVNDVLNWDINNIALPATAKISVVNKETNASFQGFPNLVFLVNADVDLNDEYPAGSKFYGTEVINQKPGVLDLIKNYIIPGQRKMEDLKIMEEKNISLSEGNHQRAAEYKNTDSKSGVIKIEYKENGKTFEEAIYGTITYLPVSQYQQYAYLSLCYGCKAIKGELEQNMGIFETILNSVKLNPKWAVTYQQVMQMAMRNASQRKTMDNNYNGYDENVFQGNNMPAMNGGSYQGGTMGNLSDYITSASGRVDNTMIQSYQNQQRSEDRISESYSDYMRGYQNFTNPNSGDVYKLSSGYSNAWTDNNGSVIMSNEAGYDPNVGGSSSWSSLSAGGSTYSSPSAAVTTETTGGE